MAKSFIGIDETDVDKKARTFTRVVGADTVHEEVIRHTDANNQYGSTAALAKDATATLVSFTGGTDERLWGWAVTGEGDAYITLEVASAVKYGDRIHVGRKASTVMFPVPEDVDGVLVELKVRNDSDGAADYDGTILTEG